MKKLIAALLILTSTVAFAAPKAAEPPTKQIEIAPGVKGVVDIFPGICLKPDVFLSWVKKQGLEPVNSGVSEAGGVLIFAKEGHFVIAFIGTFDKKIGPSACVMATGHDYKLKGLGV